MIINVMKRLIVGVALCCIVSACVGASPVHAADLSLSRPAELIRALAPDAAPRPHSAGFIAPTAPTTLLSATESRTVSDVAIDPPSGAAPFSVTLPRSATLQANSGALLSYATDRPDVIALASATGAGASFLVGIGAADAPSDYSFDFHFPQGTRSAPDAESGFDIDLPGDRDGHIFPAWAKDAEGRSLPTHYSWDGDRLTQVVALDHAHAFPVLADPAWSYERNIDIGNANPGKARAVMHNCFNCFFPVEGAPEKFPVPDQYLPLVVRPLPLLPAMNFNCVFREEVYYPPESGDLYKWGFVFDTAPGHVDGDGSWISFAIRNKPIRSDEVHWVLTVYASIENDNPVLVGRDVYVTGATAKWNDFASNLARIP
ncbi:hypothetical protein [Rathayibacter toxicus]|uniref:hypothetical protein n=1 Tax=Rathayibacter toxicus TaxID=145458 RepID=UPI0011B03743|nr:hypothetical protein [Rathayibacter toxicus]QOD11120.1 hypothetical protein BSG36_03970 [Rathayibacter toxicus]QWL27863.1 hypothetical protein E2R33_03975 [Rathayibacter toxicus]